MRRASRSVLWVEPFLGSMLLAAAACGQPADPPPMDVAPDHAPPTAHGSPDTTQPEGGIPGEDFPVTESAASGTCTPAAKVYAETLPDKDSAAEDLPLTALSGFTLPSTVGKDETRTVFTTAAAFQAAFGKLPADVDFSKEWVMFYSAGDAVPAGTTARVVRVRQRTGSVRVTTVLARPRGLCLDAQPGTPHTLVRFPAPAWSSCRVSFYHREDTSACPPAWEPGPQCSGTLTAAGLAELHRTRPAFSITSRSSLSSIARGSLSLGRYKIQHFQRTCSATGCTPWTEPVLDSLLSYFEFGGMGLELDSRTLEPRRLLAVSSSYSIDFREGSTTYYGDCERWAEALSSISYSGSLATVASLTMVDTGACYRAHHSGGATFEPIGDAYGRVEKLAGAVTDRCALVKRRVRTDLGGGSYRENLTTLYTSW